MSGMLVVINHESFNFYILPPKGIAGGRGCSRALSFSNEEVIYFVMNWVKKKQNARIKK